MADVSYMRLVAFTGARMAVGKTVAVENYIAIDIEMIMVFARGRLCHIFI
jgi:hypothetical protein